VTGLDAPRVQVVAPAVVERDPVSMDLDNAGIGSSSVRWSADGSSIAVLDEPEVVWPQDPLVPDILVPSPDRTARRGGDHGPGQRSASVGGARVGRGELTIRGGSSEYRPQGGA